jgi:hypothetical protein
MRQALLSRSLDGRRVLRLVVLIACALALPAHVCATTESWPPAPASHGSDPHGQGEHGLHASSCELIARTSTTPGATMDAASGTAPSVSATRATPRAAATPGGRLSHLSLFLLHAALRL